MYVISLRFIVKLLLAMMMLTVGMKFSYGTSSVGVFVMILSIPLLIGVIIRQRVLDNCQTRYILYQIPLVAIFLLSGLTGYFNGGMAYPSYLASILIHISFFVGCLLIIGPLGVTRIFLIVGSINIFFYSVQILGSLTNTPALLYLDFLNIMKGTSIEMLGMMPRASGLMSEPVHFSYLLLPTILLLYFSDAQYLRGRARRKVVFLIAYFSTFSLVAIVQLAIAFGIHIFRNQSLKQLIKVLFILGVLAYTYSQMPLAEGRLSAVSEIFEGNETKESSVFAIQSNVLVAAKNVSESPMLGGGLTSHRRVFENSVESLFSYKIDDSWLDMNKNDAASLYILLLSEMGLLGLSIYLILLGYLIFTFNKSSSITGAVGLTHATVLAVVSLRYGQVASVHIMLNLQVSLYCLAMLKIGSGLDESTRELK